MGLREFNAGAKAAQSLDIEGISDLRRGDSEGHLTFRYNNGELYRSVEINILSQDVSSYPRRAKYLLFVSSEGLDNDLLGFIQTLPPYIRDMTIQAALFTISRKLSTQLRPEKSFRIAYADGVDDALESRHPEPGSTVEDPVVLSDDSGDSTDFDEADYPDYGSDDDFFLTDSELGAAVYGRQIPEGDPSQYSSSIKTQKVDFLAVKRAGFSVGFYDSTEEILGHLCSISIPAARLGVSEEVLEAWHMERDHHLILLMKFPRGYPTASRCVDARTLDGLIQFELGTCRKPKPSVASARAAFAKRTKRNENRGSSDSLEDVDDPDLFAPLYLFNSIPKLLEQELMRLLEIRKSTGCSWIEAKEDFYKLTTSAQDNGQPLRQGKGASSSVDGAVAPGPLRQDHALVAPEVLSIPLVAMECALSLVVKCGTYCVNCFQKMGEGYQTMRPYVCNRDLCLDHYLSLNHGPGIEHEIINNPYVVDLLISFFYVAVQTQKLRSFPRGLVLKGPNPEANDIASKNLEIDLAEQTAIVPVDEIVGSPFTVGERVLLHREAAKNGVRDKYLCQITAVQSRVKFSFQILAVWAGPSSLPTGTSPVGQAEAGPTVMRLHRYTSSLDDLTEKQRDQILLIMVCGLPSILRLREVLLNSPSPRLSESTCLDQHSYRLLFWIISSNRSHIVQDVPICPSNNVEVDKTQYDPASGDAQRRNKIVGLNNEWLQFRFVQGSPEKELRFAHEIGLVNGEERATLFAWHGSPLGSWHGIVDEGLNYSKRVHGRSFGDGVYLSGSFDVSRSYCQFSGSAIQPWFYSELQVSMALGLCEVINKPNEFVSANPHYVVDKLDWIQCRFLMVKCHPSVAALDLPFPKPSTRAWQGYLRQDPARTALGIQGARTEIPASAIPWASRESRRMRHPIGYGSTPASHFGSADRKGNEYTHVEGEDLDGVLDSDSPASSKKRRVSDRPTDFRPGTLDWNSLPRLPEPIGASSSAVRSLTKELSEMYKIQESSDPASLGWHIEAEKVTNLLHWIVELHSFDDGLPLSQDLKKIGVASVVLELRMGDNYPLTPPFVRVIRPRFLTFMEGGGGHVTAGGAICSELLTNSGWLPSLGIEKVLLQVRLGLCELDPPARLDRRFNLQSGNCDYGIQEAVDAYKRAANSHGWSIPPELDKMVQSWGSV